MALSPVIDLGNVLTTITLLVSLWIYNRQNTKRYNQLEFKVNMMWKHFASKFDLPEKLE